MRHLSPTRRTLMASALLAAFLLPGYAMAQDAVTLRFATTEDPTRMQPVIDAFMANNPGVTIIHESIPFDDFNNVLQARIGQGDSTPDVFTADMPAVSALVQRGFLADLTDKVGDISDMHLPASMEAVTVDGRIWALPVSTSSMLMYYNVDLLEAAGIALPGRTPADRLTWEQVVELGRQAQAAGATWGLLWDQVSRIYQQQTLVESLGGGNGVSPDDQLKLDITNDAWVRAFEFYADAFESGLSPRGVPGPGQTAELFASGEVAFFAGGPWWVTRLFAAREGLNFSFTPYPYFEGGDVVTPTGSWAWGVNPNTEHMDIALDFVRFASLTEEGALAAASLQPIPPANVQALQTYINQDLFQTENLKGVGDLIEYELGNTARIRARTVGWIQFEQIINRTIEDIRNGADVRSALNGAAAEIEAAWSRLR
ncbi:ABC transporter substrate-binding protein [Pseudotabrizicola algicola]|uniref:Sugar ABC transporter substrate-binding protein n=1 Tax=Pseudotabrizicola algicola TaxID=2709381 RepID=A0A6B3RRN2_9RHOB|nr:sugar ABC transporter substrate-binding protein [Pseudotabrizicola algicola]NEX48794.1 sugar ABC transporter substrate-binding protein [Pseudotabrizicola algicola]